MELYKYIAILWKEIQNGYNVPVVIAESMLYRMCSGFSKLTSFFFPPASTEIAQVIASYTATGPEQLTLAPGQLILIRKKNPGGWWEGELQVSYCFFEIKFHVKKIVFF